jgi:uncharacterized protein YndB with AHSA1/START domain
MSSASTLTVTTPGDRDLVLRREFDASRELVFDALTKPELLRRWYGPKDWSMIVCDIDLRVGGAFRFVMRKPDGKEVGQHGVYREVVRPLRIVNTEEWEDWNPGALLVTTTLDEKDGRTIFTSTIVFPTQEVRDMLLKAGMARDVVEVYENLEQLLASLQ